MLGTVSHDQLPNYAESPSFLLSQIGARSAQVFAERLRGEGMSPREFGVLTHVAANPGQTQQQLADALGIHRNNMVGLIDEVEAAGWVLRARSRTDRRAFNVQITPTGSALVARAAALIPLMDEDVVAGLTTPERQTLLALLTKLGALLDLTPGIHPAMRAGYQGRRPTTP
ncbi:MAG TPA: MarR family transcriptional regulator [Propionibacteriaceae bacterium]|nr:MarR family transcriptional regulator [Micropruina sp.]HBY21914.1 MarR family transcriptional regulator [Propionibacteriaceae bacterium]